ncbi:cyanophycinase [Undibacterium fentianense]|uniref:Cyanophycinase n=1 Tax=Undibacterium fentianense TaxID=2828728 RepID=A0A941E2R0_9BURK|nr:cyanophycinase [Undibacterium fentianense]MBR7799574.1 cyanophycinase [Undibacterium fentianense]
MSEETRLVAPSTSTSSHGKASILKSLIFFTLLATAMTSINAHAEKSSNKTVFQPIAGIVIPMGGAVRGDNDEVRQRVVDLAGGKGAKFVVIPTSSGNPVASGENAAHELRRRGAQVEILKIAPQWPGENLESAKRAAADPENVAKIQAANGVYFTGGAQERYADVLNPKGVASPVLQAVRELQARGGVIAGTSAGAAIMSHVMFRDALNPLLVMKGLLREGKEIERGLGFAGEEIFIDQHFLKRGRIGRLLSAMLAKGYKIGLGIDENTAAVIRGADVEIVGATGALLIDLRNATIHAGPVNVSNIRISYLDNGDHYDLEKGQARVFQEKLGKGELKFRQPDFIPELENPRRDFPDILGENAIQRALSQLVDGNREYVTGFAFSVLTAKDDPAPNLGFEFVLRRDEHTRAWESTGIDGKDYSVFDARLDVRPIRMTVPLFKPW